MKPEQILPPEIWIIIAKKLRTRDLRHMSLVSKNMNEILSNPKIWSRITLNKYKVRKEGIMAIFETKFKKFKSLQLQYCATQDLSTLFKYLASATSVDLEHINLGTLRWPSTDISDYIPADVLGRVLVQVKYINMWRTQLTVEQWISFFQEIRSVSPLQIEHLNLLGTDLRQVPTEILAQALARVENINMVGIQLTIGQWTRLFQEIRSISPSVGHIDVSAHVTRHVPADVQRYFFLAVPGYYARRWHWQY